MQKQMRHMQHPDPKNIGHLDQNNSAYMDSPYGRIMGSLSQWLFG
jgi:hypothetical protein